MNYLGKDISKIGMGNCLKNKWAKKDKASGNLIAIVSEAKDEVREQLDALQAANGDPKALDDKSVQALKRRKLISLVTRKSYTVSRGSDYKPKRVKKAADLTKEMLDSGSYKTTTFPGLLYH